MRVVVSGMTRAPAEPDAAPEHAPIVLVALILVAAVANLNLAVANVALPDIGKAFDASQTTLNLVAVGYSLGLAASVLYLGALGDRYGRKLMLILGVACRSRPASSRPGRRPTACSRGAPPRRPLRRHGVPDDAGADHRAVVGPARTKADRAVVGARRRDLRARAAGRGMAARALLVGLGVPGHPAARGGRARHGHPVRPGHVNEATDPVDNLGGILSVVMVGGLVLAINFAPVPDRDTAVLGLAVDRGSRR